MSDSQRNDRMKQLIEGLLETAPKVKGTDFPAIEVQIILKSGYRAVGALALHNFDPSLGHAPICRFLSIGQAQGGGQMIAVEHFFDFDDLECLAVMREVEQPKPSLIVG